jgi:hypothetical protein
MTPSLDRDGLHTRLGLGGLACAIVGGAASAYGYENLPERFYPAYLTAFMYWLGISLGCLGLAMLHGLTGGAWGRAIRRIFESGYETLPLMALLFVPLWFGVERIYEWTDPEFVRHHETVARKIHYLNVEGFHLRAIVYFAIWIVCALLLNWFSPDGSEDADSPRTRRLQGVSGLGVVGYVVSLTLASVDWVMSLEPEWYSTMYGVLYLAAQAVSSLAFCLVVATLLGQLEPWSKIVTPQRRNDLGNLLLAFVMFWAYTAFFQYLIIWSGNLPEENVWYIHRSSGGWQFVVMGLMALHFAVPFMWLLSRNQKRNSASLGRIAALLLVMGYVNLYWLVVPGFQRGTSESKGLAFHWLDVTAFAAIGGLWLAMFAWRLSVRVHMPLYDPELSEVVDERSRTIAAH